MPRKRKRMIARTRSDNTARAICDRDLQQRVSRTALLETSRALFVLVLRPNLSTREATERERVNAWRPDDAAYKSCRGIADILRSHIVGRTRHDASFFRNRST